MSKKQNKRYLFSLTGVNIEKIEQKYGISSSAQPNGTMEEEIPVNTTKIDDLEIVKKTPEIVSFLDESKRLRKCFVSMIDFHSQRKIMTDKKMYKCFWDRNVIPENIQPIGCPIKYIASRAVKSYHSEISKENYTISEPITEKREQNLLKRKDKRLTVEKKGYYETDGIFCSFNCCMAYINDPENKHNPLYSQSECLLIKMYNELNKEEKTEEIMPAPHWRVLLEHGGHLSIDQYRESFNKVSYTDHGIISYMSLGRLFEDNLKL